jgi:acyl-CoA thioester hydrolase
MATAFSVPVRVYYEDTDAGGVVYYANYLKFMERARTEWLRALGFEQTELAARDGVLFAVRSAQVDFVRPARFNDRLETTVVLSRCGSASLIFTQEVRREGELLCQGEIKIACLDAATFKPKPIPTVLAARVELWRTA